MKTDLHIALFRYEVPGQRLTENRTFEVTYTAPGNLLNSVEAALRYYSAQRRKRPEEFGLLVRLATRIQFFGEIDAEGNEFRDTEGFVFWSWSEDQKETLEEAMAEFRQVNAAILKEAGRRDADSA